MNPVIVRNVKIGEGMPKICVPIVGATTEAVIKEALSLEAMPADLVEWRVDWFEDALDTQKVVKALSKLREAVKQMPILFTFRSSKEGGEKPIGEAAYLALNQAAVQSGYVDLVDVEVFSAGGAARGVIDAAHACGVKAVASYHDFHKTPDKEEMVNRLRRLQEFGADILKLAVMPQGKADVLALLAATEEMCRLYAHSPVITMSMSSTGVVSRICGEAFGSAVTFGTVGKASAPGQMGVQDLSQVLSLLHKSMQ